MDRRKETSQEEETDGWGMVERDEEEEKEKGEELKGVPSLPYVRIYF
jgi:hypothetical protein